MAMAADLLARRDHLRALIEAEGWTITTRNGPVMHPAARLLKNAEGDLLRLLSRLALDPEARARLRPEAPRQSFDAAAFVAAFTTAAASEP
jgi:phage terminase small subunit